MTHLKHMMIVVAALSVAACGSRAPSPSDPGDVINRFMDAVAVEDYAIMGQLWGSNDGPAVSWMPPDELRKRLTVMQGFLVHSEYEVLPSTPQVSEGGRLILRVRVVTLNRCEPVVPFVVVPHRNEWLVESVDLNAVQPTRICG